MAVGDSYASGDGTGDYYSPNMGDCYRSPLSYPPLITGYSLTFVACSGATATEVIANQLSTLSSSTNLVTIQAGGDDADFHSVMEHCVTDLGCASASANAEAFITNSLPGLLDTLYTDISEQAPNAFLNNEICSCNPWINKLNLIDVHESFHPNVDGEAEYANLIESQLGLTPDIDRSERGGRPRLGVAQPAKPARARPAHAKPTGVSGRSGRSA